MFSNKIENNDRIELYSELCDLFELEHKKVYGYWHKSAIDSHVLADMIQKRIIEKHNFKTISVNIRCEPPRYFACSFCFEDEEEFIIFKLTYL